MREHLPIATHSSAAARIDARARGRDALRDTTHATAEAALSDSVIACSRLTAADHRDQTLTITMLAARCYRQQRRPSSRPDIGMSVSNPHRGWLDAA
jgi:hypothetical protein